MRIAVIGVGALGGFFGALLAKSGEEVTFIARGATLAALRERGLTLKSPVHGEVALSVRATDDAATVGPVDLVLVCVKSYDLEAAARHIPPLLDEETVVLPVQNGVDASERLAAVVGSGPVVGGTAMVQAGVEAPGVIVDRGTPAQLSFGELTGGTSPRLECLASVFERAGIKPMLRPDIQVARWEKLMGICANAGIGGLTRLCLGQWRACPETLALLEGVLSEVHAVGRACGVPLADDIVPRFMGLVPTFPAGIRSSLLDDLEAGRRLEVETLFGTVVRLGRERGVPTPLTFTIYAALKPYEHGRPAIPA